MKNERLAEYLVYWNKKQRSLNVSFERKDDIYSNAGLLGPAQIKNRVWNLSSHTLFSYI